VLLDSGGWYSFAPDGIADAPSLPVDAVMATAQGDVGELVRERGRARVPLREKGGRLVAAASDEERSLPLPPGRVVLAIDLGRGVRVARTGGR